MRYVATCDIYAQAWAKIVERKPGNNEICSEVLRRKASRSSLVEKRKKLARGAGIGGRCVSSRVFAWCGIRFGGRYVSDTGMSIKRSATLTGTASGRALKTLDHLVLWRVHGGRTNGAAIAAVSLCRTRSNTSPSRLNKIWGIGDDKLTGTRGIHAAAWRHAYRIAMPIDLNDKLM